MSCPFFFSSNQIDLSRVKRRFAFPDRIAPSAFLRREIANRMHERLALLNFTPRRILDAGCGEGADLSRLKSGFPSARIFALDASYAMLKLAEKERNRYSDPGWAEMVCGNFAQLPFVPGSFEVLWSNLALHWFPEPLTVFKVWRNILSDKGGLWFSCFGPETIRPLKEAFKALDDDGHVLEFMEMHDLGDCLLKAGFPSPVLDREMMTITYSSIKKCLQDIQSFGGNVLMNRKRGLMGKNTFQKLMDLLEKKRNPLDGTIHMPFEIIYGHAFCTVSQAEKKHQSRNINWCFS